MNIRTQREVIFNIKRNIDYVRTLLRRSSIHDAIIVSGAPRTGTTLLMDILSTTSKYVAIFEPLHPFWFPQVTSLGFPPRIYLPPEKDNLQLSKYLDRVFRGLVISNTPLYSLKDVRGLIKRITSNKALPKFVNGNRILPWISHRFDLRATYIIIRHPCATISSQIQTGWIGYPNLFEMKIRKGDVNLLRKIVLQEISLIPAIYENLDLVKKIEKLGSIIELLAVEWSLDYWIPLTNMDLYDWNLVVYEDLLLNGQEIVESIFKKVNEPVPNEVYKILKDPTIVSKEKEIDVERQLLKWKKSLSESQIIKILDVVGWFNLDFYSTAPEPDYLALKNYLNCAH